jgi:hypothetical protein
MKSLLSFRITVDHEDRNTPVYANIKLYREDDCLIWRIDGENGDECETLPRPKSIKSAKDDAPDQAIVFAVQFDIGVDRCITVFVIDCDAEREK